MSPTHAIWAPKPACMPLQGVRMLGTRIASPPSCIASRIMLSCFFAETSTKLDGSWGFNSACFSLPTLKVHNQSCSHRSFSLMDTREAQHSPECECVVLSVRTCSLLGTSELLIIFRDTSVCIQANMARSKEIDVVAYFWLPKESRVMASNRPYPDQRGVAQGDRYGWRGCSYSLYKCSLQRALQVLSLFTQRQSTKKLQAFPRASGLHVHGIHFQILYMPIFKDRVCLRWWTSSVLVRVDLLIFCNYHYSVSIESL